MNSTVSPQHQFLIADPSAIAHARRGTIELAVKAGFDETDAGRLALAVTECATNLLKHAGQGELLVRDLQYMTDGRRAIEVLALDRGPGIEDVTRCFEDGFSTAGSSGTGLGAIRRIADELDLWTRPGAGLVMRCVIAPSPGGTVRGARGAASPALGIINVALAGEPVCGDAWCLIESAGVLTVMVADGLGHGAAAHVAATAAVRMVYEHAHETLEALVERAHLALRATRGAAIGLARIDSARGEIAFISVGNIAATVWRDDAQRHLMSHNGIVGHSLRKTSALVQPFPQGAVLIMASDGLGTRWDLSRYPGLTAHHPALIAAILYRDAARGRDDVTVLLADPARS